jgi:hypothetical protein
MSNENQPQFEYQATIANGLVHIEPNCDDLLVGAFDHDDLRFGSDNGSLQISRGGSVWELDPDTPVSRIPLGFFQRVRDRIESYGHEVILRDCRQLRPLGIDRTLRTNCNFDSRYPALLDAIEANPNGVIEVARGPGRTKLIGSLCSVLADLRILVTTATLQSVNDLYSDLYSRIGPMVVATRSNERIPDSRVAIGTFASLRFADASVWDVLVFEDADEACTPENIEILHHEWQNHRVYAFRGSQRRGKQTRLKQEGMFGPRIFPVNGQVCEFTPSVVFAKYSAPMQRVPDDDRGQAIVIQQCHPKANAIAQLAISWTRGQMDRLDPNTIVLDIPQPLLNTVSLNRVLILAGSRAQAQDLTHRIAAAVSAPAIEIEGVQRIAVSEHRMIEVCTPIVASKLSAIDADLIVVAGGGRNPGLPPAIRQVSHRTLIVDFVDEWNERLTALSEQRRACYQTLNYEIYGFDPSAAAQAVSRPRRSQNQSRGSRRRRQPR